MHKDNGKTRQNMFKYWDLLRLVLEIWQYIKANSSLCNKNVGHYVAV